MYLANDSIARPEGIAKNTIRSPDPICSESALAPEETQLCDRQLRLWGVQWLKFFLGAQSVWPFESSFFFHFFSCKTRCFMDRAFSIVSSGIRNVASAHANILPEEATINWYPGHMAKATSSIASRLSHCSHIIDLRDSRVRY